jgi:hypothetical protein
MLGIDWADIDAKFRALMPLSGMGTDRIEKSLAVIRDFRRVAGVAALTDLLRPAA